MNYDVIIIGAGSAGCVLASRLSEDPNRSVLLLEAGPDYADVSALPPEIATGLWASTVSHDWGFKSEPDASGRTIPLPRGKLVGGCAATNSMVALRGTPADYDEWAAGGNPGWAFNDVLPFFRRLEQDMDCTDAWHGQDGPLPIRRYQTTELTKVTRAFMETCITAGYPAVFDHNTPGAIGVGPIPLNLRDGMRQSTALTYLAAARARHNLAIRSGVLVDHVRFNGERAIGIQLANPAETVTGKQIILAAGAYGSPAILLRSGLGPVADLRALGIPVRVDLMGVGRTLIDHPRFALDFVLRPGVHVEPTPRVQIMLTWRSSLTNTDLDFHIASLASNLAFGDQAPVTGFSLLVMLLKPRSQGQLRLRSAEPSAAPCITPGYFTHPDDLPRMVEVTRMARQLARTTPLSDLIAHESAPGVQVADTDDALAAALRAGVGSYHHPVATCRMGPDPHAGAVVDAQGHVHGVEGLWVMDASIMPTIPAANTNLPTIMVAERCAAWFTNTQ
ncbi:MAG: GMC family oxidoreductase [Chloroflexota bacterium]